jgi:endogenous inhibitor of DNA gyrase (YacG/DUF329 family)
VGAVPTPKTVACPHCGAPVAWTPESRWRPFCSERCKMIDAGAWASEAYRAPVDAEPDADALAAAFDDAQQRPPTGR